MRYIEYISKIYTYIYHLLVVPYNRVYLFKIYVLYGTTCIYLAYLYSINTKYIHIVESK